MGAIRSGDADAADGTEVARNDDWSRSANADAIAQAAVQVGAFPLVAGSHDAALLTTVAPGNYTALVSDTAGRSGIALVEAYDVPANSSQ